MSTYEELHHEVMTIITIVRNAVVTAADTGHYRRTP